jgi:hypothetical protein
LDKVSTLGNSTCSPLRGNKVHAADLRGEQWPIQPFLHLHLHPYGLRKLSSSLKAGLSKRQAHKKGKRKVLDGQFRISTPEIHKTVVDAELESSGARQKGGEKSKTKAMKLVNLFSDEGDDADQFGEDWDELA